MSQKKVDELLKQRRLHKQAEEQLIHDMLPQNKKTFKEEQQKILEKRIADSKKTADELKQSGKKVKWTSAEFKKLQEKHPHPISSSSLSFSFSSIERIIEYRGFGLGIYFDVFTINSSHTLYLSHISINLS